jgi:2-oxoglutarate dehydrogenase E1 component
MISSYRAALDGGYHTNKTILSNYRPPFAVDWNKFKDAKWNQKVETAVRLPELKALAEKLTAVPAEFKLHPRVEKVMADRRQMGQGKLPLDWGMAENLAYAALLKEGYAVRISGQDSGRGTFFHRHAVLHDQARERWDAGRVDSLAAHRREPARFLRDRLGLSRGGARVRIRIRHGRA